MKSIKFPILVVVAAIASAIYAGPVKLSWTDNSKDERGFEVWRDSTSDEVFGLLATVAADVVEFTDESVEPGHTYSYKVRAFNEAGYSGYTNVVAVTTQSVPLDPTAKEATELPSLQIVINKDGSITVRPAQ